MVIWQFPNIGVIKQSNHTPGSIHFKTTFVCPRSIAGVSSSQALPGYLTKLLQLHLCCCCNWCASCVDSKPKIKLKMTTCKSQEYRCSTMPNHQAYFSWVALYWSKRSLPLIYKRNIPNMHNTGYFPDYQLLSAADEFISKVISPDIQRH